jgi:hypothetical protein
MNRLEQADTELAEAELLSLGVKSITTLAEINTAGDQTTTKPLEGAPRPNRENEHRTQSQKPDNCMPETQLPSGLTSTHNTHLQKLKMVKTVSATGLIQPVFPT